MSSALHIIDTNANRGGSGHGVSFYESAYDCPRKARLDAETEHSADPGYSAKVGIVGHAMLDIFYSGDVGKENIGAIQVSDVDNYENPRNEAVRLVTAYLERFPEKDFWGEVVGAEISYPQVGSEDAVKSYFGVELTARLDLVTRVSLHHADRIRSRTNLSLVPGVYIIDHKFKPGGMDGDKKKAPRREKNPSMKYGFAMQFKAYPEMWNIHNPGDPCMGMVANIIVGIKEPDFQPTLVPAATEHDIEVLRTWLAAGNQLASTDLPIASRCYNRAYDSVCYHFTSGRCSRA
jgi:hypothetical protein